MVASKTALALFSSNVKIKVNFQRKGSGIVSKLSLHSLKGRNISFISIDNIANPSNIWQQF